MRTPEKNTMKSNKKSRQHEKRKKLAGVRCIYMASIHVQYTIRIETRTRQKTKTKTHYYEY